ncbi:MAG: thiol-activated cytolysin family protein, partial [Bacteroidota bacterium]
MDATPVVYRVAEDTVELDPIPGPNGGELVCKTVKVDASQVRDLSKLIDLGVANLYPGAIIQGGRLADGEFISVDIETAGNTLIVDGLSGGQDVTAEVASLSEVDVKEGINDLLNDISGTVEGTAAEFSYVIEQAFSQEEFQFHAGLGIGFPLADVTANLYTNNSTQSSRVMLQFNQKFYSISIPNPEDEYALFRRDQRTRLQDSDQISAGNPPLYVKTVHYGRQIFFLAESDYSTRDLAASLDAAYRGAGPELRLQSGLSVGEVIDNSKVTYVVRGGGAGIALRDAPSFEAVQEVIQAGAEWGLNNPGVPIAYDMRYLTNEPAYLEFYSIFERKECELLPAESPGPFSFEDEQIASFGDISTPGKVYVGDFNGDGMEDILLNHLGSINTLKIGLGSSSGQIDFQPAVSHPESYPWSQYQTHVGDFDGDGNDDVAWTVVDNVGNRSVMALSQGGGSWDFLVINRRDGNGWGTYTALVADTDNNGKDELIFNRLANGQKNSVWSTELNDGLDEYIWTLLYDQQGNWGSYRVSVGNVDGGGDDLIWQSLGT